MDKFLSIAAGFSIGLLGTVVVYFLLYFVLWAGQPDPVNDGYWRQDYSGLPVAPTVTLEPKP